MNKAKKEELERVSVWLDRIGLKHTSLSQMPRERFKVNVGSSFYYVYNNRQHVAFVSCCGLTHRLETYNSLQKYFK